MEVIDCSGGVAAMRIIRTCGGDLRFECPRISLGVLIRSGGWGLRHGRTEAKANKAKPDVRKSKSAAHRAPSTFAFSFACTIASELRQNSSVVTSPSQLRINFSRGHSGF